MKARGFCISTIVMTLTAAPAALNAQPYSVGTAFTYQGQLKLGSSPYSGTPQMIFDLYDDPAAGTLLDGYGQLQQKALTINYRVRPDRLREGLDRIIDLYESWNAGEPDKGYAEKAAEWRAEMATAQPTHRMDSQSPVAGD